MFIYVKTQYNKKKVPSLLDWSFLNMKVQSVLSNTKSVIKTAIHY